MSDTFDLPPHGAEPEVTSQFGLELENARLKEELAKTRIKVSRLRGEVRRLHKKVFHLMSARRIGFDIGVAAERIRPQVDLSGHSIPDDGH